MIDGERIEGALAHLAPLPDASRANWSDVVRRARTIENRSALTRLPARLVFALVAVAVAAIATVAYAIRTDHSPLTPGSLSALADPATVVNDLPPAVNAFTGAAKPAPGSVHQLGYGALAWRAGARICWVGPDARQPQGGAGGCVSRIPQPVDWTIKDPDADREGAAPRVFGLAIDSVKQVSVTLIDGTTVRTTPLDNFYVVDLPGGAAVRDVTAIRAALADGSTFTQSVPPDGEPRRSG